MQHHQMLIIFALLILAFGLFSRLAERNSVTGPMFFMTVGILASFSGVLEVTHELGPVKLVAELALMLVLFIDASLIDFASLRCRRFCSAWHCLVRKPRSRGWMARFHGGIALMSTGLESEQGRI